jgi:RNA polymerase sigma-70 factor (ECF subfamily)
MPAPDPVFQAFEEGSSGRAPPPDDLPGRVARVLDAARSAFPELAIDPRDLARHLGRHVHDEPAWERLRPAEFALCLACGRGSREALSRFEVLFEPTLRAALRRFATANVPADELSQLLRERLFVGSGSPKILEYSGQGFLENWLRVTAVRTFTDAVRSGPKREVPLPEGLLEAESGDDVELAYLKTHYRAALKQAFEHAVGALEGGSRNLLRQSVVQRLTIDQIGALYGIHRATAARRVEKAKADLLVLTRARLMEQLHVEETELDSIMNLVRSRFDLSVGRVLSSGDE